MSYYTANVKLYENSSGAIGTTGNVLAFNANDVVPDATVTANSLLTGGLVTLQTGGGAPVPTFPVTVVGTPANTQVPVWNNTTHQWEPGAGSGTSLTVQDEGTPLATAADTLNFVGAGVTATGTGTTKTITVTSGGSGLPANAAGVLENNGSGTLAWTAKTAAVAAAFGWVIATDPAYGAVGNGTTDDTAALQAAINATPVGATLFVPSLPYKITDTLVINKAMTLKGGGMSVNYGSITSAAGIDAQYMPSTFPVFRGAVLNQRTAAKDAVSITVTGAAVHVQDVAVLFGASGDAVIFQNTGHGFNCLPPTTGATRDQGVMAANWYNVAVYGHDGNHYAYRFVNLEYSTFTQIQAFGGGGWYEDTIASYDGSPGGFGNNTITSPYFVVCAPGTAHGVERGSTQTVLLETWIRPQIWMHKPAGTTAGLSTATLTGPTTSQYVWKDDTNGLGSCLITPDFETDISSSQFTPDGFTVEGNWFFGANVASTTGYILFPGGRYVKLTAAGSISGANRISTIGFGGLPEGYHADAMTSGGMQAAAGTSPPAPVVNGTVIRGNVTFGTGTATTTGRLILLQLSNYDIGSAAVIPVVSPNNAATALLGLYVEQLSSQYFYVGCTTAPTASQGNTVYNFTYHVYG